MADTATKETVIATESTEQQTNGNAHVINGHVPNGTPFNAQEMRDHEINEQKRTERQLAAQFQPGNQMAKGHKRGRQKLSGQFIDDLAHEWNKRGNQALSDLTSKDLVNTCTQVLPKDVLLSLGATDAVKWVISATPGCFEQSSDAWMESHGLEGDTKAIEDNSED